MTVSTSVDDKRGIAAPQERFARISGRQIAAMARFPSARFLEILPFQLLVPRAGSTVLDLFAGTGFASAWISSRFNEVILVDSSAILLQAASPKSLKVHGDATDNELLEPLTLSDVALSLAGFHHVLDATDPNSDDRARHAECKLRALKLWRHKLAPGGRLILADVPRSGALIGDCIGPLEESILTELPDRSFLNEDLLGKGAFDNAWKCRNLREFLTLSHEVCSQLGLREPEPAEFFDKVVAKLSPGGHIADFRSVSDLISMFRWAGFTNVSAFVAPTPWLFPCAIDALWFVHELLGIGQHCPSPSLLRGDERNAIAEGIAQYLNLRILPNGACALAWKLVYVVGDNP